MHVLIDLQSIIEHYQENLIENINININENKNLRECV